MSNTLVVYYSLTSNTRQIAEAIAAAHDADLEVIEDTFNRDTGLGRPRSAIEGLLGHIFPQCHRKLKPSGYDNPEVISLLKRLESRLPPDSVIILLG